MTRGSFAAVPHSERDQSKMSRKRRVMTAGVKGMLEGLTETGAAIPVHGTGWGWRRDAYNKWDTRHRNAVHRIACGVISGGL